MNDHVKAKIRMKGEGAGTAVARARKEPWPASLAKVLKKAASIAELLSAEDQAENVRVIREAKNATHQVYDAEKKLLVSVPDHKTRMAAVALDLAYTEGRPTEKHVVVTAKFEDLNDMMHRLRNSPEAVRRCKALGYSILDQPADS
ncbi:MAG: hypothetical protein M3Y69_07635 [Verrucomicrobiota bacterium]|nr:hypothetical protein [Verrucomicrobiota bacterium]